MRPTWLGDLEAVGSSRLDAGAREYGDRSFGLPPEDLRSEVLEELVDVTTWLFVWWCGARGGAALADRRRAWHVFMRRVRRRVAGNLATRDRDVCCELERLAAVGAVTWHRMRQSLFEVVMAHNNQTADPARQRRQRGGIRE